MERGLEYTQVGQGRQIGDAKIGSYGSLKIYTDEGHEILHASCLLFFRMLATE